MAKRIVITSGKGGVGKTTVTANLGIALAYFGKKVLLVDVDFGLNNLDVVMGVENKVAFDMIDVINGRCRPKQAIIECGAKKNLYVLPSIGVDNVDAISGQNIKLILENLSQMFDYILIDCPAGLDLGFHRAVSCADQALVVATPSLPCLRDADKTISILGSYKLEYVGLIVNRVRGDLILSDKMMYPKDIEQLLKIELKGVLPEEDSVFLTSGYKLPNRSDSSKAYKILANNIVKGTRKIFDVTSKYSGFFGSIRGYLKRTI